MPNQTRIEPKYFYKIFTEIDKNYQKEKTKKQVEKVLITLPEEVKVWVENPQLNDPEKSSLFFENVKDDTKIAEDLKKCDLTSLLRLISIKENGVYKYETLKGVVKKIMGLNPLPIKLNLGEDTISLRPHQEESLMYMKKIKDEMNNHESYGMRGCILKLEMGLGKTLTSISTVLTLREPDSNGKMFPSLVIVSKTLMIEWQLEGFEKFFGNKVKVLYFHEDYMRKSDMDNITRDDILKYDFVITTYDLVVSTASKYGDHEQCYVMGADDSLMAGKISHINLRTRTMVNKPDKIGKRIIFYTPFEFVIADESQRFSNPDTKTFKAMMAVYGRMKICLTGTPIRNYNTDIWTQFRWLGYKECERTIDWKRDYSDYMNKHDLTRYVFGRDISETSIVMPNKIVKNIPVQLEDKELEIYSHVLGSAKEIYDGMISSLYSYSSVLAAFTRLRQVCVCPYLISPNSKRKTNESIETKKRIKKMQEEYEDTPLWDWLNDKKQTSGVKCAKMLEVAKIIKSIPDNEKVLIFSSFACGLDIIADTIREFTDDFAFEQLDGSIVGEDRADILRNFKTNPKIRGLLLNYKIGSEGLNLTQANHVISVEPWWTPVTHEQAEARAFRPGQKKDVYVYNIFIEKSIEEYVMAICEDKRKLSKHILQGEEYKARSGIDKDTMGKILNGDMLGIPRGQPDVSNIEEYN